MDYGPEFDQELEKLLWEFLIRLDQLLPVPSLTRVEHAADSCRWDFFHVDIHACNLSPPDGVLAQ